MSQRIIADIVIRVPKRRANQKPSIKHVTDDIPTVLPSHLDSTKVKSILINKSLKLRTVVSRAIVVQPSFVVFSAGVLEGVGRGAASRRCLAEGLIRIARLRDSIF